jgi:formylglycine-generating enzyme required for sulfatase activity
MQLLPILEFIHKRNVIHRDLKPENIMRRRSDNQLVLVDFGAAKHATATALAKTGTSIGSASYAAPEQARGRAVFASDLYSLGVTCLHLLTGVDPFTLIDDSTLGFAWRDFLNSKRVSDEFGKILDKMTQQRPIDRYATANEVLQALEVRSIPLRTPQTQKSSARSFTENLNLPSGSTKLEMIAVPSGRYKMGGRHQVSISAFSMGKHQITQAQYESVMGTNPSHFKGANLPVEQVSWNDTVAFCQKLSQKTGKQYCLPSEAEWEYACRSGSTTKYCFGDSDSQLKNYAWYDPNSGSKTHTVGQKKPNAWGLYDMHGNVWEWCADNWESDLSKLPKDGKAIFSSGDSSRHSFRGGSWYLYSYSCRSVNRFSDSSVYRYNALGFRVVCVGG